MRPTLVRSVDNFASRSTAPGAKQKRAFQPKKGATAVAESLDYTHRTFLVHEQK